MMLKLDPDRHVGRESRKAYYRRCETGFWDRYIAGPRVIDIGYVGGEMDAVAIIPGAFGIDADTSFACDSETPPDLLDKLAAKGFTGHELPFDTKSIDTIHSSHVLEHVTDAIFALQEWYRVLRFGGTMIIMVPHAYLYERRLTVPPSRWSPEHLRSYTPATLLREIEAALPPNGYRVEHLSDVDEGYLYELPPLLHPLGSFEIEIVIRKREVPDWSVES